MDIFDLEQLEARALYLRCRGISPEMAARTLNVATSKFYEYQKSALEKLEIPGKPKEKYGNFVRKGGCELLLQIPETDFQNWYEIREELRKIILKTSEKPALPIEPLPDKTPEVTSESKLETVPESKSRKISLIPIIILITLGVGVLIAYLFSNSTAQENNSTAAPVTLGATILPLPSQTQEFTSVPASETAVILTDTPLPTNTPTDTPLPTKTFTLTVEPIYTLGDRVKDNRVSLSLEAVKFNTAVSGVARTEIAVDFNFKFTNLTSGELTLLIDKYNLSAVDNIGRTFSCTMFKDPYIRDDLSEPLQPGQSMEFSVMCGLSQQITTDTEWIDLTITEFTSLSETTWRAKVER